MDETKSSYLASSPVFSSSSFSSVSSLVSSSLVSSSPILLGLLGLVGAAPAMLKVVCAAMVVVVVAGSCFILAKAKVYTRHFLWWHNHSQLQHANSTSSLNLDCSSAIRSACITFKSLSMLPRPYDDGWSSLTTVRSTPSSLNKSDKHSFKPRIGIS